MIEHIVESKIKSDRDFAHAEVLIGPVLVQSTHIVKLIALYGIHCCSYWLVRKPLGGKQWRQVDIWVMSPNVLLTVFN